MASNLKVLINNGAASIALLQFIKKNITEFNEMNVVFKFRKILADECNEELVSALSRKGINRLPTVITPEGKSFVGNNAILALLNKNLNAFRASATTRDLPHTKPVRNLSGNDPLQAYWNKTIGAGDEAEEDSISDRDGPHDFDKRSNEQMRMREDRYNNGKKDSHANVPKRAGPPTRRPAVTNHNNDEKYGRDPQDYDETLDDNITNRDDDARAYEKFMPQDESYNASSVKRFNMGNHDDDKMMAAWMDNNM